MLIFRFYLEGLWVFFSAHMLPCCYQRTTHFLECAKIQALYFLKGDKQDEYRYHSWAV
jgi:hypothetical protein